MKKLDFILKPLTILIMLLLGFIVGYVSDSIKDVLLLMGSFIIGFIIGLPKKE